jgi:hypothetical protein
VPRLGSVQDVLAAAPILNQAGLLQLSELRGDPALSGRENLLQLGDGQFLPLEQEHNAQPAGIREQSQALGQGNYRHSGKQQS